MKKLILSLLLIILCCAVFGANFKVYIGLTQPITPAMSLEDGRKILLSMDILSKLDLDFRSAGPNLLLLENSKKYVHIYNKFDMPFIDIGELVDALGIEYIRRNENITIYNKILSASCENGYINVKFAFSSSYEYYYWNNYLVVDLIGSIHSPSAMSYNRDVANVSNILFGQVTLDSARCMFKLNKQVANTKPKREIGSEISLALALGAKQKNYTIDSLNIFGNVRDSVIQIKGGAGLKYNIKENVDTGDISISFSNGSFTNAQQKVYNSGSIKWTVSKNTITAKVGVIQEIKTETKLSDLIITVSPAKGTDKSFKNLVIVIDPGHGGNDSGAKYKTLYEKNINYKASLILKEILEKKCNNVYITREENGFLSLNERGQFAIDKNADIFISIHTNSTAGENKASGLETYYRGNMFSAEYLGKHVHNSIMKVCPLPNKGLKRDTILYSTGLGVLRKCNSGGIPCLLIELGFVNHKTDRVYLQSDEYMTNLANAISDGIENYIKGKPYSSKY